MNLTYKEMEMIINTLEQKIITITGYMHGEMAKGIYGNRQARLDVIQQYKDIISKLKEEKLK